MGYIDQQIAAAHSTLKKIGDSVAGKGLRDAIRKLQDKAKIRNSLEAPAARGDIIAKRKLALRTGAANAGLLSPFTEQEDTRTFHDTLQSVASSDGLFVISYKNVYEITMKDAGNNVVKFIYDDYEPT